MRLPETAPEHELSRCFPDLGRRRVGDLFSAHFLGSGRRIMADQSVSDCPVKSLIKYGEALTHSRCRILCRNFSSPGGDRRRGDMLQLNWCPLLGDYGFPQLAIVGSSPFAHVCSLNPIFENIFYGYGSPFGVRPSTVLNLFQLRSFSRFSLRFGLKPTFSELVSTYAVPNLKIVVTQLFNAQRLSFLCAATASRHCCATRSRC